METYSLNPNWKPKELWSVESPNVEEEAQDFTRWVDVKCYLMEDPIVATEMREQYDETYGSMSFDEDEFEDHVSENIKEFAESIGYTIRHDWE